MGKKYVIELEDSPFVGTWKSSDEIGKLEELSRLDLEW